MRGSLDESKTAIGFADATSAGPMIVRAVVEPLGAKPGAPAPAGDRKGLRRPGRHPITTRRGFFRMHRFALSIISLGFLFACAAPRTSSPPGDIAAAYQSAGRLQEASREIELAVRVRPRDISLRRQAAQIYIDADDSNRAIQHLETAIQLTPRDGTLWLELAEIERDRQNIADAYVAFRRASSLAPTDIRAVSGLALSAENLGFVEEASDAFARWAELKQSLEIKMVE
jgi:tetratricopeptide (TPR) repeat protein